MHAGGRANTPANSTSGFRRPFGYLVIFFGAVMVLVTLLGYFARIFTQSPPFWTEELGRDATWSTRAASRSARWRVCRAGCTSASPTSSRRCPWPGGSPAT